MGNRPYWADHSDERTGCMMDDRNTAACRDGQALAEFEKKAELRKKSILCNTESAAFTGKAYYVSCVGGRDENSGLSPQAAWASLSRVNAQHFQPGDAVLFERGGLWRGQLLGRSGVTYAAYGSGEKPRLYGATENAAHSVWFQSGIENIYVCGNNYEYDAGLIVFNHGEAVGVKKLGGVGELTRNFDFFHSMSDKHIYLYLDKGNPGELFCDIEIGFRQHILWVDDNASGVTVENLCLRYGGAHGIWGRSLSGVNVRHCELGWIGGSLQTGTVRYGNGIEFWRGCRDIRIEDCYVHQIYDAGLSHQYSGAEKDRVVMENVTYRGNLVESCTYSIEYFVNQSNDDGAYMKNIRITDNILRFAGMGWGSQRPDKGSSSHIKSWDSPNLACEFMIDGNVLDRGANDLIHITTTMSPKPPFLENNTYIQYENTQLGIWQGIRYPYRRSATSDIAGAGIEKNPRVLFAPGKQA